MKTSGKNDPLDMAIQKIEEDLSREEMPIASFSKEGVALTLIMITADRQGKDKDNFYAITDRDVDGEYAGISIYEFPEEEQEFELGRGEIFFGDGKIKLTFEDAVISAEDKKPKKCSYPNWWSRVKIADAQWKTEREMRKY